MATFDTMPWALAVPRLVYHHENQVALERVVVDRARRAILGCNLSSIAQIHLEDLVTQT
jgi:hypothetical protein